MSRPTTAVSVAFALALGMGAGCGGATKPSPGAAVLASSATAAPAQTTMGDTELIVVPPSGGVVTTFQTDVAVAASSYTGDTISRAVVGLRFQPVANRSDDTNAIYLKITLENTAAGLLAKRYFFECTDPVDCSTSTTVGQQTGGAWANGGVDVTLGAVYTASISWDPTAKIVTYTLSSSGSTVATATVDLMQAVPGSVALAPPFDVSAAGFKSAFLASQVRGGAAGGGNGSMTARFDAVNVGLDGKAASLFDDFDSESAFDPARWSVRGDGAAITSN